MVAHRTKPVVVTLVARLLLSVLGFLSDAPPSRLRPSRLVRIAASATVGITMAVIGLSPAHATTAAPSSDAAALAARAIPVNAYRAWANTAAPDRCLTSQNTGDGAPAFAYDCWAGTDQFWRAEPVADAYVLRNLASGRCLTSQNLGNGAPAFSYHCWNGADQLWRAWDYNGYTMFQNVASGRCLTAQARGNGSPAFTYDCWAGADQLWFVH